MDDSEFFAELLENRELFVLLRELRAKELDINLKYHSPRGTPNAAHRYTCQIIYYPTVPGANTWESTWGSTTLLEAVKRVHNDAKHEGLLG